MNELFNLPKIHTSNSFISTGETNPISISVKKQRRCSLEYACNMALSLMTKDGSIYHNEQHVIDVGNFVKEIMAELKDEYTFDQNISKCIVAAALMHDVAHPAGVTNKTVHDSIVNSIGTTSLHLETIHTEVATHLMRKVKSFSFLPELEREKNYDLITELIMATDVKSYFEPIPYNEKPNITLAKLIIRCADLCHVTKNISYHLQNVKALNVELGFDLSPKSNVDFIQKCALPLYTKLHTFCDSEKSELWLKEINNKIAYWNALTSSL
jgi:hypothetical protein